MNFLQWIRPSVEGDDSKASIWRLSALVILGILVYLPVANQINTTIHIQALIIYAATFLLLVGIIKSDQLFRLVKDVRQIKE